jgi:hypothetical protein
VTVVSNRVRDVVTVERVEGSLAGAITLVWTSVETSRVGPVPGRLRVSLPLHGFLLEPVDDGRSTRVVHILQASGSSFLPRAFASQMLARRAICIAKIREELDANGPPTPLQVSKPPSTVGSRRSTLQSQSSKAPTVAPVAESPAMVLEEEPPAHVVRAAADVTEQHGLVAARPRTEEEDAVVVEFNKAVARLKEVEARPREELEAVIDYCAQPWLVNQKEGIVRSEARVEDVTVEQVLGTLISRAARRICKGAPYPGCYTRF